MKTAGFTLIELIVSVTILLLLAGLLVAGYNGFNSSQTVLQAASTLKNNLRAARTAAASGAKPTGCVTLIGYEIDFPDASTYTSGALCIDGTGAQSIVGSTSTYRLPGGVLFTPVPGTIIFYPINRGASAAQNIVIQGNTKTASVRVSGNGSVE